MRYRLMDVLACPVCKNFPLKLYVFEQVEFKAKEAPKGRCELFCAYKNVSLESLEANNVMEECERCISYNIRWGLIFCEKCGRWYPVSEEIPVMLPDELRKREEDVRFLKMFEKHVPREVLERGKPHHL